MTVASIRKKSQCPKRPFSFALEGYSFWANVRYW